MSESVYCNVCKKCNGCQLSNLGYNDQLKYKQKQLGLRFNRLYKPERILPAPSPVEYRNKAQIVFKKDSKGKIRWGIYQSAEKGITLTENCPLHTKRANLVANTLCNLFEKYGLSPFDFKRKKGFVRSVLIREGFSSGEMLILLVCSKASFKGEAEFCREITKIHPYIKSIVITESQSLKLTTGGNPRVIFGSGYIEDTLSNLKFFIGYNTFYQINPLQTERLYSKAIDLANLNTSMTVLDAYCGIGTIALTAANKCKKVIGIELNENSIVNAQKNAELNGITNTEFYADDVKKQIKHLINKGTSFDVCFVDPPRLGCDIEFLKSLIKAQIPEIIYISCNIDTQVRDVRFLMKNGYKLEKIQGVDMFPYTKHIECIAKLSLSESI